MKIFEVLTKCLVFIKRVPEPLVGKLYISSLFPILTG